MNYKVIGRGMRFGLLSGLLCTTLAVDAAEYVVGLNTKRVRVYDAAYNEIDRIKKPDFLQRFVEHQVKDNVVAGLIVKRIDDKEQMVNVELSGYDTPVWLEESQVKLWPPKQVDCPDPSVARKSTDQRGVSIGFSEGVCK